MRVRARVCVCVRPHLGDIFVPWPKLARMFFSCEDFFRVLRKCMCLFVSPCNKIKTCMCVSGALCLAMRILSVCLSVRPSVKRVNCDKMEERSAQIFIPYERSFSLVFLKKKNGCWGRPLLPEILGQPTPVGAK